MKIGVMIIVIIKLLLYDDIPDNNLPIVETSSTTNAFSDPVY